MITCGTAELIGIGVGAAWWITIDQIAPDPVSLAGRVTMLGLKSFAGLVEEIARCSLQSMVLRRIYPRLSPLAWGRTYCVTRDFWLGRRLCDTDLRHVR